MPARDLETMDHTLQLSLEWVGELRERLGWSSNRDATRLLRAVLCEVRDRLPHAEMADLAARMPLLIRGMYYEGWEPARTPLPDLSEALFEAAVIERLGRFDGYRGRADIAAVFAMLANRMTEDELRQTRRAMPRSIRDLWPPEIGVDRA